MNFQEKRSESGLLSTSIGKGVGALAAAGAIFGAIHFGPKALEDIATDESAIVGNVPGLVLNYDSQQVWTGKVFIREYWLEVEQCPQDIEAAKQGNTESQSFNNDPTYITEGCFTDWVRVSGDAYSTYAVGTTITFDESPSEHLRK